MEIPENTDLPFERDDSLCRVCLFASDNNKCIFTSHVFAQSLGTSTELWEKLEFYGGIEVKQGDGFPSQICDKCFTNVIIAHDFRVQCQESDKKLRSMSKKVPEISYDKSMPDGKEICSEKVESIDNLLERNLQLIEESNVELFTKSSQVLHLVQDNAINSPSAKSSSPKKFPSGELIARPKVFPRETVPAPDGDFLMAGQKSEKPIRKPGSENNESRVTVRATRSVKQLCVVGRMTSLKNLKNRKERQRRYVKKTMSTKKKKDEREKSKVPMNICPQRVQSDTVLPSYKWQSEKSLEEHRSSPDPDRFHCYECDKGFGNLLEFLQHTKSHEKKETPELESCKICNKSFRKASTMVRHLNIHKRDNPRAVYGILKEIRDRRKKQRPKFSCRNNTRNEKSEEKSIIDDGYENSLNFEESEAENREKSLGHRNFSNDPLTPDRHSATDTNFSNFSRTENSSGESEAPRDDKSAIKIINTWIREELDSDNEGRGFPCDYCKKSYVTEKSLLKHSSKMHDESRCKISQKYFSRNVEIQENNEKSKYRCEKCEESFEDATKFEKHMNIHEELRDQNFKRFLCHICSKTFRQNTGLMFHMRTHTGYKPHVCKHCGRAFTSRSNCINHERTHTGDRPFVCHFCSAAFAKSCTLKAHITTHTGEANYHCKTCGKSFRRLKYLKEHRFTHTGEKPYACKICGTAYSHSGSLFSHEKKCKARGSFQNITGNYADGITAGIQQSDNHVDPLTLPIQRLPIQVPGNINGNKILIDGQQSINQENDHIHSNQTHLITNRRNFNFIGQTFTS